MTDKKSKKRDQKLEVRLNGQEVEKITAAADNSGVSIPEFVRDWIKSLKP